MPELAVQAEWMGVEYLPSVSATSAGAGEAPAPAPAAWVPAIVVPCARLSRGGQATRLNIAPSGPVASLRLSFKGYAKANKVRREAGQLAVRTVSVRHLPAASSTLPKHPAAPHRACPPTDHCPLRCPLRRTSTTALRRAPSASWHGARRPASQRRSSSPMPPQSSAPWRSGPLPLLLLPPLIRLLLPLRLRVCQLRTHQRRPLVSPRWSCCRCEGPLSGLLEPPNPCCTRPLLPPACLPAAAPQPRHGRPVLRALRRRPAGGARGRAAAAPALCCHSGVRPRARPPGGAWEGRRPVAA